MGAVGAAPPVSRVAAIAMMLGLLSAAAAAAVIGDPAINEKVPAMLSYTRFYNIDDPGLLLKAFNFERHKWNKESY